MYIISPWTDYYDHAVPGVSGAKEGKVWLRKHLELQAPYKPTDPAPHPQFAALQSLYKPLHSRQFDDGIHFKPDLKQYPGSPELQEMLARNPKARITSVQCTYYRRFLICANTIYPVLVEDGYTQVADLPYGEYTGSRSPHSFTRYFWTYESCHVLKQAESRYSRPPSPKELTRREQQVREWFKPRPVPPDTLDIQNALGSPLILLGHCAHHDSHQDRHTINPNLRHMGFAARLDPVTCWQELSMYVDGVMTQPEPPEPVSNETKIQAHGMDHTSFRRPPTKKR